MFLEKIIHIALEFRFCSRKVPVIGFCQMTFINQNLTMASSLMTQMTLKKNRKALINCFFNVWGQGRLVLSSNLLSVILQSLKLALQLS